MRVWLEFKAPVGKVLLVEREALSNTLHVEEVTFIQMMEEYQLAQEEEQDEAPPQP